MSARPLNRRAFHCGVVGAAGVALWPWPGRAQAGDSIQEIESLGPLVSECAIPGETRHDDVVASDGDVIQVSRARWVVIYHTRGFRGVDDERSVIYQVRKDFPNGPVLKEELLEQARAGWEPKEFDVATLGKGRVLFKQHGHTVAFGVPKGALLSGRAVPHANHFVALWRVGARILDVDRNMLLHSAVGPGADERTRGVEWVQFRFNDREDDIEILAPVARLRQRGFETGRAFCRYEDAGWMNQSYVRPVPVDRDATEWAVCNHFKGGRVAALRFRFEPMRRQQPELPNTSSRDAVSTGRYAWVETGPFLSHPQQDLWEASLIHLGEEWGIATRIRGTGIAWSRTPDPFREMPRPMILDQPATNSPRTAFLCGDGGVRLFTGDVEASPYRNGRDPLYCWDVEVADGYRCVQRRTIFDSVQAGVPIRKECWPKVDFGRLVAPQGDGQLVTYRVCTRSYNFPYVGSSGEPNGIPVINDREKAATAWYCARLRYRDRPPLQWDFGAPQ